MRTQTRIASGKGLPFGMPQDEALEQTRSFVAEVKAVVPRSQVVVPKALRDGCRRKLGTPLHAPRCEKRA
jgi:hypothetical protein